MSVLFRSVFANYQETKILKGIEVYRFTLQTSTLASPTVNPHNQCFCRDPKVTKNCTMAGVLDISSCQEGTFVRFTLVLSTAVPFKTHIHNYLCRIQTGKPIYISLPHFLYGSPSLTDDVQGLNPIEEDHFTYLDVEPVRAQVALFLAVWGTQVWNQLLCCFATRQQGLLFDLLRESKWIWCTGPQRSSRKLRFTLSTLVFNLTTGDLLLHPDLIWLLAKKSAI